MTDKKQQPHIKAKKNTELYFSPIWILPILALVITAWLTIRVVMESKISITIEMRSAEGIVAGKTQIKFRGINAGLVTSTEITEDLSRIIVHADINPSIQDYLTTETQFWLVSSKISLSGVSGLETVLSGDYITLEPSDKGSSTREFIALKSAPPIGEADPGMRITLQAEKLGSISEGSQLFYRQIPVGEVRYFQLSKDSKSVQIHALIEEQYGYLVNQTTVFWNSGGVRIKGSLSGFEMQTESLSSILAGGISLFTTESDGKNILETTLFELHEDYDSAGVGVPVQIGFASGYDLKSGITKVKFHGIDVGHLEDVQVSDTHNQGVIASVIIDPGAEGLLKADTDFWLVKPNLSLSNLSNLDTLVSGNYITLKVGTETKTSHEFTALDGPPPPDFNEPGLHLYLKTKSKNSLSIGTPILFKGVEVGQVVNVLTDDLNTGVGLHVQIRPDYSQLINVTTRFWNVSGVEMSAGLGGIKVRAESMMSIVRGGIAFETTDPDADIVEDGHQFYLRSNQSASESNIIVKLRMKSAEYLEPSFTKLKFKGFEAGTLLSTTYDAQTNEVIAELGVDPRFKNILNQGSIFWLVKPKLKASEIKGIDALFSGVYFAVQLGEGEEQFNFTLADSAPALDWSIAGLHLTLKADSAGSLQPGSGVYFQEILVGSVQSVLLNEESPGIIIQIHILAEFSNRVQSHSRFFNVSGMTINASASGIKVETGSIDSMLSGGIAFDTDVSIKSSAVVKNGEQYQLFASRDESKQQGFPIVIELPPNVSVTEGSKVTYNGIEIGEVNRTRLNNNKKTVQLYVNIQNEMRDLVRLGSQFWLAKTQFGLLRQENLGNLISGPEIRLVPGMGELTNNFDMLLNKPVVRTKTEGLNLILETDLLGSVALGVPVSYRQITVGEVIGYELSSNANSVLVYINIEARYQSLIRDNTRFWNASGINIDAGLFSGVQIQAESLENLLSGGVAFATPDKPGEKAVSNDTFKLHRSVGSHWKDWQPSIPLD